MKSYELTQEKIVVGYARDEQSGAIERHVVTGAVFTRPDGGWELRLDDEMVGYFEAERDLEYVSHRLDDLMYEKLEEAFS